MNTKIQNIENKFQKSQDALVLQQSDLSLKSISDMVTGGAIDIYPKYQRRKRWDAKRESDLIESFILNIPVPPIYLAEDEYGSYSVIDGKQRITAINNFLTGRLKLQELEKFEELEGFYFEDLPESIKNALKIRPYLRVVTLLRQSDSDLKHEVFLRLNKAGVPLNSQEIRNVAFRGALNDLLFELSADEFFNRIMKATPKSTVFREMTDVQFVLRYFTVKEYWSNFHGNMDKAMDAFMILHFKSQEDKISIFREDFHRSLRACRLIWGDDAYLKPGGSKRVLQGFFDVQMVCLGLLNDNDLEKVKLNPEVARDLLVNLVDSNKDFLEATTQFTSNPKNVFNRIDIFVRELKNRL